MPLKNTLRNMLSRAQGTGQPARTHLQNKLTISLMVNGDICRVQLSRVDTYPSNNEWRTVLQQWPGQVAVVKEPNPFKDTKAFYLLGKVRMIPDLIVEERGK